MIVKSRITIIGLLFLFAVSNVNADAVDDLVLSRMRERNIPGAAIAVVKNGRVVKMKGYGVASLEFNVPVTTETVFEIGSVSKQMTAAGIMLLVQDGKVNLDERISKYLPSTPEAWKEVTVRHLLTHTSGIKSYTSLDGFELSQRMKIDDFIKKLSPHPLEFLPGEKNIYSNSGFNLLAYIIETQSGKKYLEFMREKIFVPLGMTKTVDRDPQFVIPLRASGYEWRANRYNGRDGSLTDLMGAGSIVSTISDMTKWEAALRGDKFLTNESKKEIWKQYTFNNGKLSPYGLGWRISDVRAHKLIGHTGQTAGFGAAIFRYVENDVTVIVLTNLGEIGMGSLLAASIVKKYVPTMSLKALTATVMVDREVGGNIRSAISDRHGSSLNEMLFSDALLRNLKSERTQILNTRLKIFAPINAIRFVKKETTDAAEIYNCIVETPKRIFLWRIAVDNLGKIIEMNLEEEE